MIVPDPDLRKIFGRYPAVYAAHDSQHPRCFEGFSGASVWRVETAAGPCALRAMNPAQIDPARLAGLHRLVAHVRRCGLPQVAVPIGTLDGTTFFEQEGALWQLEPWMPGTADFWTNPTAGRLEAALESLARWHIAAARFEPRPQEASWFFHHCSACSPGLSERLRELERWDAKRREIVGKRLKSSTWKEFGELGLRILDAFARQAPALARELSLGTPTRVPLQPCLRDVWHDHLLYTGETITGLIDPHAARSDSPAIDLARLLGSLVADDRQRWEAGLAAYQRIRPLSLDELALVGLFDRSSVLLSGMTWLDWYCLEGREFADQNRVLARLRAIVGRLQCAM